MADKGQRARVAYAIIGFAESRLTSRNWGAALRESLTPGTCVERYGRRWYMAQWVDSPDGHWITGKLAFEQATESEIWDAERNDVKAVDSLGTPVQSVPFVIDIEQRRVAFELRAQTVKPGSFQGNIQALLATASVHPWRVTLEGVKQAPWDEWATSVKRVTSVWITMRTPNPHSPIPEIEELFKKPGVKVAQVVVQGDDIPTDASLVDGALGHAFDYGKVSAEAVVISDGAEHKESWSSEEEGGVLKDSAHRDESGHVPPTELQRLLLQRRPREGKARS
jgi:hypothetical protein